MVYDQLSFNHGAFSFWSTVHQGVVLFIWPTGTVTGFFTISPNQQAYSSPFWYFCIRCFFTRNHWSSDYKSDKLWQILSSNTLAHASLKMKQLADSTTLQWETWCSLNCNHIYNHLSLPAQTKNWLLNSLVLKGMHGAMVSPAVVTLSTRFRAKLWIYWKMHVYKKNWLKLCISWLWSIYSISIRYSGHLHKFLRVLKNINFD
jgi:hypothetical protein